MKLIPVDSSNIKAIGYDENIPRDMGFGTYNILVIQFKSDKVYGYIDFPKEKFYEFLESESKGKFFNNEILNKFETYLLQEPINEY